MAMTRFEEVKKRRYFYVRSYRRVSQLIIFSLALNVLIVLVMAYIYFNQQPGKFYSSNGSSYPIELIGLNHPNKSSLPLLPDEEGEVT
jgi:hypothetical protein